MLEWVYGLFLLVLAIGTIRNIIKDGPGGGSDDPGGYGSFNSGA
jgi:hypothetical protein